MSNLFCIHKALQRALWEKITVGKEQIHLINKRKPKTEVKLKLRKVIKIHQVKTGMPALKTAVTLRVYRAANKLKW